MVMMPPELVLMRASSTVFVKASSLVNRDLAGILEELVEVQAERERAGSSKIRSSQLLCAGFQTAGADCASGSMGKEWQ